MTELNKIPRHVAIIMDGNGRWAQERGRERSFGHINGVESVRKVIKGAVSFGIEYLTLYTFSTENWGRPQDEVDTIMELLCKYAINEAPELIEQGVKVKMIGSRKNLSEKVKEHIDRVEKETSGGNRLTLLLAINYSSRSEIIDAANALAQRVADGTLQAGAITEQDIAGALYTASYPDPDMIIRTSGEYRLSNFLMWQAAYSEFYFTDELWPDFTQESLKRAIDEYARRNRRFGKLDVTEIVNNEEHK